MLTGNNVLKGQMNYTLSKLKRIKSAGLAPLCTELYNIINPLVPTLAAYNITLAEMLLWQSAIANYNGVMNAPRMSVIKRKELNESLTAMFADALEFVREVCDPTATYFKEHANEFYLQYESARKLDPTGIHHTRFISTLQNEIGEIYRGQTITIRGRSQNPFTYTAISNFFGVSIISGIQEDELGYDVTVSGSEVETKTFGPFLFQRGKSRLETLVCQPQFSNIPQPLSQPQRQKATK